MLIDFVKIVHPVPTGFDFSHFPREAKEYTITNKNGEIIRQTAEFKGIRQTIIKGKHIITSGSIHQYANDGSHNYNNLNFNEQCKVLTEINRKFKVPFKAKIQNTEIGLNIQVPEPVENYLDTIILYNGKTFNLKRDKKENYDFLENVRQRFIIKIYSKSGQYKLNDNILRFEIRVKKMEHLSKIGIKQYGDLLDRPKIIKLSKLLIADLQQVVSCESVDHILKTKHKEILLKGLSPNYWIKLKNSGNRHRYDNELRKFKNLIEKYNLNKKQKQLEKILINTLDKLLISVPLPKLNPPNQYHKCIVTGHDISMQKPTSKFLNITGLKYYQKHKPEIYHQLLNRLTDKWQNEPEHVQLREIAHGIRNQYFNKHHNNKRDIKKLLNKEKTQPTLFNCIEYIDKKRLQLSGLQDIAI